MKKVKYGADHSKFSPKGTHLVNKDLPLSIITVPNSQFRVTDGKIEAIHKSNSGESARITVTATDPDSKENRKVSIYGEVAYELMTSEMIQTEEGLQTFGSFSDKSGKWAFSEMPVLEEA